VTLIELIRSYVLIKTRYTKEEIDHEDFDSEHNQMIDTWTKEIDEKQVLLGNTYMVRDRGRWSIF
jgi:hypothetical protein